MGVGLSTSYLMTGGVAAALGSKQKILGTNSAPAINYLSPCFGE